MVSLVQPYVFTPWGTQGRTDQVVPCLKLSYKVLATPFTLELKLALFFQMQLTSVFWGPVSLMSMLYLWILVNWSLVFNPNGVDMYCSVFYLRLWLVEFTEKHIKTKDYWWDIDNLLKNLKCDLHFSYIFMYSKYTSICKSLGRCQSCAFL